MAAGDLTLNRDGDYYDVTGTDTISKIVSLGKGTQIHLHFDDILTIEHHATDLVLPNSEDITTYAGLELCFREYDTSKWRLVGGAIVPHDHSGEEGGGVVAGGEAIRDAYRGLVIHNTVGQEDAQVDVDADELILHDIDGNSTKLTDIDLTIDNANGSGINKLDTGSVEVSKWYFIWVVKGDTGNGGLLSLSSSLPTILGNAPAGYNDSAALLGTIRTDASSDFLITYQMGNRARCNSGSFTVPVAAATISLTALVPETAKFLYFRSEGLAPLNLSPQIGAIWFRAVGDSPVEVGYGTCPLEVAQEVYGSAGVASSVKVVGWED